MRTTVSIDDHLLEELRKRAAESGTSVSRLIEDAIRASSMNRPSGRDRRAFKLVTFGKGGHFTRFDVDRIAALLEDDDVARHGRRR